MSVPAQIGKFSVSRQLGAGAMGAVFLARHPGLGQEVAIKVLHDRDPEVVARFRREAEIMARIRDPRVVQVFEAGIHEGQLFLALEYVQGQDLAERLKERGALPPAEAIALLAEIARGVEAAHQAGVIHRDLKPANVLLDASGRPKVTDFGISARTGAGGRHSLTATGVLLGTPAYMAPEQALDARQADARSDVYALGAILHECLSGQRAFRGASGLAVLTAVVEGDAAPLPSGLPEGLREVVRVAMSLDPGDRYSSARLLAQALEEALQGASGPPRREVPALLLGAAALTVFGGLAGWGLHSEPPPPSSRSPIGTRPRATLAASVQPSQEPSRRASPGHPPVGSEDYFADKRSFWRLSAQELRAPARRGHPAAQARLGQLFLQGAALPQGEGEQALRAAASAGDPEGMRFLAVWIERAREGDEAEAKRWKAKAASHGSGRAVFSQGGSLDAAEAAVRAAAALGDPSAHTFLVDTALMVGDREEALVRLEAAIRWGIDSLRPTRGRLLRNTAKPNYSRAFADFQAGAELGSLEGVCSLARCYALGQGVKKDLARARELVASAGSFRYALFEEVYLAQTPAERSTALNRLVSLVSPGTPAFYWGEVGLYLLEAPGSARGACMTLLRRAKPMTSTDARVPLKLGIVLSLEGQFEGEGPGPLALFERAEALGHSLARYVRAECILLGRGAPRDVPEGLRLLEEAGQAGSALAWNRLGNALSGRVAGVNQDLGRALECFLEAAELGHLDAMLSASHLLWDKGDQDQARRWTLEGAARVLRPGTKFGYARALEYLAKRAFRMGLRAKASRWCARGRALNMPALVCLSARLERLQPNSNWDQVAVWYRQAYAAGDAEARFGLARCLTEGWGLEADLTRAGELVHEGRAQAPEQAFVEDLAIAVKRGDRDLLVRHLPQLRKIERGRVPVHIWGELGVVLRGASRTFSEAEAQPLVLAAVFCFTRAIPGKSVDSRVPFYAADLVERGLLRLNKHPTLTPAEAVTSWFRRASNLGHGAGSQRLGERLIQGLGGPKNVTQGLKALRKAGGLGVLGAWEELGDLHAVGLGDDLPKDLGEARAAYQAGVAACGSSAAPAPEVEGRLYAKLGAVLLKLGETKEGVKRLKQGLTFGEPLAEIGYGGCLLSGRGGTRSPARGLALLERHAPTYVLACEALAAAYRHGVGVTKDLERAAGYADQAQALLASGAKRWPLTTPR